MTYPGPRDSDHNQRWRKERREIARIHHPDRGGDVDTYIRELQRLDDRYRAADAGLVSGNRRVAVSLKTGPLVVVRRLARRGARHVGHGIRRVRTKIPVGWPGARRYTDL